MPKNSDTITLKLPKKALEELAEILKEYMEQQDKKQRDPNRCKIAMQEPCKIAKQNYWSALMCLAWHTKSNRNGKTPLNEEFKNEIKKAQKRLNKCFI